MGKLLRILVVVFLLLSVAAFIFGFLLFGKRELLKGRTQKLEKAIIDLAPKIETEAGSVERKPDYPLRDISPVTSEIIDPPEASKFWDTYSNALEVVDLPLMDLSKPDKKLQLMNYYKFDPVTQKIKRDDLGQKVTEGEGTMQAVLDDLQNKASAQYTRLNETRRALKACREELVSTVTELNQYKKQQRVSLKEIETLKAEVAKLTGEVAKLKKNVEDLTEEKKTLEEQVAEQKRQVQLLDEQVKEKDAALAQSKKALDDCLKRQGEFKTSDTNRTDLSAIQMDELRRTVQAGDKGTVVAVNSEWNFCVLQLDETLMKELLGADLSKPMPTFELMIKRPGKDGKFVTKVRLVSLRKAERLAIADILLDWKQMDVQKGDVVFHQ